ncbi:hypothetical protein T265_03671 [Opisthorchis viverrini]|uniref:Uncharacterized protein n=1 Tax=Opisthorchis viverrini TaxID=6198 RepID=A0A074ZRP6_OPIVI|nr:hypothetical protein T265_03671 [Opisthorchis viverrini]KER29761.1 hypothetical protein T265_03671 [Opisthorchis viverrini]
MSKDFQCLTIDVFGALPESGGNTGPAILKYAQDALISVGGACVLARTACACKREIQLGFRTHHSSGSDRHRNIFGHPLKIQGENGYQPPTAHAQTARRSDACPIESTSKNGGYEEFPDTEADIFASAMPSPPEHAQKIGQTTSGNLFVAGYVYRRTP